MLCLKCLHIAFPVIIITIVLSTIIRNYKNGRSEKEILINPVYVEPIITKIVPDTPSKLGVVNIKVDYEFNTENGTTYRKKHARTVIKTMNLCNYKVGAKVSVVCLNTDPFHNMLNVKSEIS